MKICSNKVVVDEYAKKIEKGLSSYNLQGIEVELDVSSNIQGNNEFKKKIVEALKVNSEVLKFVSEHIDNLKQLGYEFENVDSNFIK